MSADLDTLAHRLAYQAARSDIECCADPRRLADDRALWWDIACVGSDEKDAVQTAVRYLDLRRKLTHHPVHEYLVSILDDAPEGDGEAT